MTGWAFHPRVEARRRAGTRKLHLRDSLAMAIGGMIGGGIFSVLGVTVALAGHLAWLTFVIAGLIALSGVGASALSEDLVVAIKLLVLALISAIGFVHFAPARLTPIDNLGWTGVIIASTRSRQPAWRRWVQPDLGLQHWARCSPRVPRSMRPDSPRRARCTR